MTKKSAILLYRQIGWSTEILLTKTAAGEWDLPHDDSDSSNVIQAAKNISQKFAIGLPTTLNYLGLFRPTISDKIMGYMRDVRDGDARIPRDGSARFVSLREALFLVDPVFIPMLETFYANHTAEYKRHCA